MPQKFTLDQPVDTHRRSATCEEVDCIQYLFGWVTVLDPENKSHIPLIDAVLSCGKHFTQMRSEEASQRAMKELPPGLMAFVFPAGQQCFRPHTVPVGRLPFLYHDKNGRRLTHTKVENFTEDFNEQAEMIRAIRRRG